MSSVRNHLTCNCGAPFISSRSDAKWCDDCKRIQQKKWRKSWRETRSNEARERDLAKHRIRSQRWKDANREKVRADGKAYAAERRASDSAYLERQRLASRLYTQSDPVRAAEIRRRSYLRHAEQRREESRERYRVARDAIYERDGGRCHICRRKVSRVSFHVDHLIPRSKGGPTISENLAIAHAFCNQTRSAGRLPAQLRLVG